MRTVALYGAVVYVVGVTLVWPFIKAAEAGDKAREAENIRRVRANLTLAHARRIVDEEAKRLGIDEATA